MTVKHCDLRAGTNRKEQFSQKLRQELWNRLENSNYNMDFCTDESAAINHTLCGSQGPEGEQGSGCGLTWLAAAPAAVGDSAPPGLWKGAGLSTGEFLRL